MLNLIMEIKLGKEPAASRALNKMVTNHLSLISYNAIQRYSPIFHKRSIGEQDDIKSIILETVWNLSKQFKGSCIGEWLVYCRVSINNNLKRKLKEHSKKCVITYIPDIAEKYYAYCANEDIVQIEETLCRKEAFLKTSNLFSSKKEYLKIINILAWDPYMNSIQEVTRLINTNYRSVRYRLITLAKAYNSFYGGNICQKKKIKIQNKKKNKFSLWLTGSKIPKLKLNC